MNVGKNIAALRKSANLTQEQLAEKCGVSRQAVTKWETGESEPSIERLVMLSEVFQVTIDELVTNKKFEKQNETCQELSFKNLEDLMYLFCFFFSSNRNKNSYRFEKHKSDFLLDMYIHWAAKWSKENKVYDKYLIQNTTKEEREKYVGILANLDDYNFEHLSDYINGKCEINVVMGSILKEIEKRGCVAHDIYQKKMNSVILDEFYQLQKAVFDLRDWDEYSEKKQQQIEERVCRNISEIDTESLVGRIMNIYGQEITQIYANKDLNKAAEIEEDLDALENFIWSKIPIEKIDE